MTPWTVACQACLSFTNSQSLLKRMSIESVIPSNCLIPVPFSSYLPSFPASGSFQMSQFFESGNQVAKVLELQYQSFQYSGLISLRMDWLDLLTVQGTLKSLLQHHRLKASILWHSAFIMVQLLHPHITTGKAIYDHWRTPKLQLAAEQPSTGECWIPPIKDAPHPRAKKKPQQDSRRGHNHV